MSRSLCLSALIALGLSLLPTRAHAFANYASQIPNGSCDACHVSGQAYSVRDAFGQVAVNGGVVNWPSLYSQDADGDQFTNGEELGDPCGVWAIGQVPAFTGDLGDPGDAALFPATHTTDTCGSGPSSSSAAAASSSAAAAAASSSVAAASSSAAAASAAASSGAAGSSASASASTGSATTYAPPPDNPPDDGGDDDSGCGSTLVRPGPPAAGWAVLAVVVAVRARRR